MILAMENAGKLIEDEELREQIKDGINGIITDEMTAESLYENIYHLSKDKAARSAFVKQLETELQDEKVPLQKIYGFINF